MTLALPISGVSRASDPRVAAPTTLLGDVHRQTDRTLMWLLVAHLPLALALAPLHGTWLLALGVGGSATLAAVLAVHFAPGELSTRLLIAIALVVYSALMVQQTRGSIEMHFHFFCVLSFLLMYRDWRVPVVAALVIAVHHALFNYLQVHQIGDVVVFASHTGWGMVALHAAFVIFQTTVLIYMARQLEQETRQSQALISMAERLGAGDVRVRSGADAGSGVVGAAAGALNDGVQRMGQMLRDVKERALESASLAKVLTSTTDQIVRPARA